MRSRAAPIAPFTSSATTSGSLAPFAAAKVLAEAIRDEQPDLVLTGLQSDDHGYGQTGVIIAELFGPAARDHRHRS